MSSFLSCYRNFHMKWISLRRSPVLRSHLFYYRFDYVQKWKIKKIAWKVHVVLLAILGGYLLFTTKWAIILAVSLCEHINLDEMMMMFTSFKTNTLSWIFIVLAQWNNRSQADMLFHSYNNCFDLTGSPTDDLLHWRWFW